MSDVRKKTGKKGGFKFKNLPEDAYKGQQQRLKQNLIQQAKLKKQYAKVLKQESVAAPGDTEFTHSGSLKNPTQTPPRTNGSSDARLGSGEFTNFEAESDVDVQADSSSEQTRSTTDRPQPKSYRARMKARKSDTSAIKAASIKEERDHDRDLTLAKRAQIDRKRANRTDIKRRETSRTRKGQPLMKDRMKNILDRLQSEQ